MSRSSLGLFFYRGQFSSALRLSITWSFIKRKKREKYEIKKLFPRRQNVPLPSSILLNFICLPAYSDWMSFCFGEGVGLWLYIQEINDNEELPIVPMDGRKSWQFEQLRHSHVQPAVYMSIDSTTLRTCVSHCCTNCI